jgi:hypothetical protein
MTALLAELQFQRAFALAHSHGHWWAVQAAEPVWAAAANGAPDEALTWDADGDAPRRGPRGPEELAACRRIAAARDPRGWGGHDYSVESDGCLRHLTCTGKSRYSVSPEGEVFFERLRPLYPEPETVWGDYPTEYAPTGASFRWAPDGRVELEVPVGTTWRDIEAIAWRLRALGLAAAERRLYLLAAPGDLARAAAALEAHGTENEYASETAALLRGALAVLAAPRSAHAAARARYIEGGAP